MKNKSTFVITLAVVVMLLLVYQYTNAEAGEKSSGKLSIAVVSVRGVFEKCQRKEDYSRNAKAEQDRIMAELEKLSREIDAARAGLNILKPDSDDYMTETRELFQKQAGLQAQQEFYKQLLEKKDHNWTERLYADILEVTAQVAEKNGFDLVLEKNGVDFPSPNINELMLSIRTHKILYAGGCEDITEQVTKIIDMKK